MSQRLNCCFGHPPFHTVETEIQNADGQRHHHQQSGGNIPDRQTDPHSATKSRRDTAPFPRDVRASFPGKSKDTPKEKSRSKFPIRVKRYVATAVQDVNRPPKRRARPKRRKARAQLLRERSPKYLPRTPQRSPWPKFSTLLSASC
jgi:hypothetical protein